MLAAKRRFRPGEPDALQTDDGRLICRTAERWEEQRRKVYDRARGLCEACGREAPLHNVKRPDGSVRWRAGEADHRKRRKVRDDNEENLRWLCPGCHRRRDNPAKVVPAK